MLAPPRTQQLLFSMIGDRADFIVTPSTYTKEDYLSTIKCVIEVQSEDNENLCELQMLVYLLILMNTKHLPYVVGFLVLSNVQCRAFKVRRNKRRIRRVNFRNE